ncbi:MAG: hypothetical protein PVJ25_04100, partial [Desulfuromonadales bacterium]
IRVRFPLVGTVNDAEEHVAALGRFLADLGTIEHVDLLVYHNLAGSKYKKLGKADHSDTSFNVAPESVEQATRLLEAHGLTVHLER